MNTLGNLDALNAKAAQGYRLEFLGNNIAVLKYVKKSPNVYRYSSAFIEDHPNGCFNQFNLMGAQSYRVAALTYSTVYFEKEPLPRNHHYFIGHQVVSPSSNATLLPNDSKDIRSVPVGPQYRLLRVQPFLMIEADGEFKELEPKQVQAVRIANLSLRGHDDRLSTEMNRLALEGFRFCSLSYGTNATFCSSGDTQRPVEYTVVRLKSRDEVENRLAELGERGFRLVPVGPSASDNKLILERPSDKPASYSYRVIPIKEFATEDSIAALEAANGEGFEPIQLVIIRANPYLVFARQEPGTSMEKKP